MSKLRDTRRPARDDLAGLGRRARRWSRRAERRAVADHERWVGQTLQRLARVHTPVLAADYGEGPPGPAADAGVVSLTLPGWRLILADVACGPRLALADVAGRGFLQLDAAGRYGRFWWIQAIGEDSRGAGDRVVLLGSHLNLSPISRRVRPALPPASRPHPTSRAAGSQP